MKITKRQLRRIIREEKRRILREQGDRYGTFTSHTNPRRKPRGFNAMSPASKSYAQKIKRDFLRLYDAQVGIDTVNGWITVNGRKAVNMSQASGQSMSDEEMISKMEDAMWGNSEQEERYAQLPQDQPHVTTRVKR